jgi:hypothetical protein
MDTINDRDFVDCADALLHMQSSICFESFSKGADVKTFKRSLDGYAPQPLWMVCLEALRRPVHGPCIQGVSLEDGLDWLTARQYVTQRQQDESLFDDPWFESPIALRLTKPTLPNHWQFDVWKVKHLVTLVLWCSPKFNGGMKVSLSGNVRTLRHEVEAYYQQFPGCDRAVYWRTVVQPVPVYRLTERGIDWLKAVRNQKPKGKRGPKPTRDAKRDKRIWQMRQEGMSYKAIAREVYGDNTKTREVGQAIDSHRQKLRRKGHK